MQIDRTITEGTVIHATLRVEDLIPAFWKELERIDPDAAHKERDRGVYAEEIQEATLFSLKEVSEITSDMREAMLEAAEHLENELTIRAPEGMYFGTYPGDASDYGWWKSEGEDDMATSVGRIFDEQIAEMEEEHGELVEHDAWPESRADWIDWYTSRVDMVRGLREKVLERIKAEG